MSTSQTGSVDKVVLEAMACEKPVVVCNETFKHIFGDYTEILMFKKENSTDLAEKIMHMLQLNKSSKNKLCRDMREIVKKGHNVKSLMGKLIEVFKSCRG